MDKIFEVLPKGKKVYFASDFHLGAPPSEQSIEREKRIIRWLQSIEKDAAAIFLLGDIFDFWFEYKRAIPKGFIRLQGKFAELVDQGIPLIFFTGNHDLWMFDYFTKELGIPVYRKPREYLISGKVFLIGHGDGLGPGDHFYKFLKKIFENKIAQWLFKWVHPDIGMKLAHAWSKDSRISNNAKGNDFKGEDEWLWQYCKEVEKESHHDYYIFGHRHLPLDLEVAKNSRYINLAEWVNYSNYAVFNGSNTTLETFKD
ncbi:MAG: UDP-2,3-diacylglucosamine diphosphatase [Bacteroidota bacterium]